MQKSIYLNDVENQAVQLLAKGKRMGDVREACGLPQSSYSIFLADLRRKTGIHNIQDVAECSEYLRKLALCPEYPQLSEMQTRLLIHFMEGDHFQGIMQRTGLTKEKIINQTEHALELCGIFARNEVARRVQVRLHFAIRGNPHSKAPELLDKQRKALQMFADGENMEVIGMELGISDKRAKIVVREACHRAGIKSPGRNVQRQLARAFIDATNQRQTPAPQTRNLIALSQYDNFFMQAIGISLEGIAEEFQCDLTQAVQRGLSLCKRARVDHDEATILKRGGAPVGDETLIHEKPEEQITMDDPAF